jgi:hypothetical protein
MAKPIVAQPNISFASGVEGPGNGAFHRFGRTKQAKPYDLPTAYEYGRCYVPVATRNFGTSYLGFAYASSGSWPNLYDGFDVPNLNTQRSQAINLARDKFLEAVREDAMLAVNLAERKQALGMITERAGQLLRFTRAIKRGRLGDAAAALHLSSKGIPKGTKWRHGRSASSAFLEFHFGWEPAIKDIWTASGLLAKPVSWPKVEATGKKVSFEVKATQNGGYTKITTLGKVRATVGASVRVTDPNLWLLNQLGLLNPASVVWELIPWSFLWDWVFNMGQWLSQWTDLCGLELTDPWYTTKATAKSTLDYNYAPRDERIHVEKEAIAVRRTLGFPSVTLGRLPYKPLSGVRAATAVSLLAQQLPKRDAKPDAFERRFKNIAHPAWYAKYLY